MAEQADPGDYDSANPGTANSDIDVDTESTTRTLTDLMDAIGREAFSRYLDHTRPFRESSTEKS